MNSASIIRILILVIPAVWVVFRLMPVDHPQYSNLRAAAQQGHDQPLMQEPDAFSTQESSFKAHYQSHFVTSGYEYNHYRLAYKYGFDLALNPDHQSMNWASIEPRARDNWNERTLGPWSLHRNAVLYGWEQGVKKNRG
jgi:hypothetical protein